MSSTPIVVIPHVLDGLRNETVEAVYEQWPGALLHPLRSDDPYAYADAIRFYWRTLGDLIVCEQDVVPPPGAIRRLIACDCAWCTHRHWLGTRYHDDTLGLAKFSWALRRRLPDLADAALAREDPRQWVRKGWTGLPADTNEATLNRRGRRACVRPDASEAAASFAAGRQVSTVDWRICDSMLARQLRGAHVLPHVHEPPTHHLRRFQ